MKMRAAVAFILILILLGCGKATKPAAEKPVDKIIATVNSEPIYNKDLKLALALKVKEDPSFKVTPNTLNELLDDTINERLRLQGKEKSKSNIKIYTEVLKGQ